MWKAHTDKPRMIQAVLFGLQGLGQTTKNIHKKVTYKRQEVTTANIIKSSVSNIKPLLIIHCTMLPQGNNPIFFGLKMHNAFKMVIKVLIMKELL